MRMRPHVDTLTRFELRRSHVIEKDERPDHTPLRVGQRAAYGETAKVGGARYDHEIDRVACRRVAGRRVSRRKEAHRLTSIAQPSLPN
jgi:hypothetical protein